MKKFKEKSLSMLTLTLILATLANIQYASTIKAASATKGPRTEDLIILYYSDVGSAYAALKAGEIDILGSEIEITAPQWPSHPVDDYVWATDSITEDGLGNNGLPGRPAVSTNPSAYNGFGTPNWTGNFSTTYGIASVNQINVTALPFTGDEYTYTLTEGVDYIVYPDDDLIELITPLDVPITNEHWVDGVNNTLNGWPYINYVATGIQSVYVRFPNGTERYANNTGFEQLPPGEWWYEPDWPWELEGWWALGYFPPDYYTWPADSEWWINYTAASYLTIAYNAETPPESMYFDAIEDPNIVLGAVEESGFSQFDPNNNYTIKTYPGIRSPTNYRDFRQAVAFLTDKDYIVDEICGGFATRIDQPIAAPYYGWANASMSYPNYPYEYDPDTAATTLDANFSQGSTSNPYYNASISWSAEFIRTYPADHPKAGQDLDPLEVVIRTDDIRRYEAGLLIISNLRTIGIPVNPTEGDILSIYDKVFGDWDYHLYTGGWSVGRFPPLTLYRLFHSSNAFPYGPNYVTGFNASNLPNYPYFDTLLRNCRDAQNYSAAFTFTKLAAGYHVELAVSIPLWSSRSYWAWRTDVLGVVNMLGAGPENDYNFLNAYKMDGSPIRYGLKSAPMALNQLYSSWYYDFQNLDRMNLYNNLETPPYDLSIDQPGFVENWETSTWVDPADGKTKTKVTQRFRTDAYFVKPVTGAQGANVNSSHYFFAAWMIMQLGDTWFDDNFIDVHHITMVNTTTIEIYYDTLSYWNTYYAGAPLLPMDTWVQQPTLVGTTSESFIGFTGPGSVSLLNPPVWIASIDVDGTPLTHGVDWNIIGGTLEILTAQSGTLNVQYWYAVDPYGYTPGNEPWQAIFEGAGMYYAVDFVPSVGGHLTLKRNPFYYMETPTLGEIDFLRNSPNGGFQVDFYDLALVTGAIGSQGTGIPDPNWFPGADVFSLGGLIDDFDLSVVICAVQGPPSEYHDVAVIDVTPEKTVVSVGDPLQVNVTIGNQGDYNENFVVGVRAYQELVATENVTLASGENTTITLIWNTAGFDGNYTISAYAGPITPLGSECDLADNILIDGEVQVKPQTYQIPVQGQQYNLTMESNTILTQIIATKNTLHVKAEGPSGQTAYINATIPAGLNTTEIKVFINNVPLTYPPFPIITTNTTHYFIYFEFTLSTHEIVLEYGPPETVITSMSSSKTIVGQGYSTLINVTIHNQGDYTKTFNVTVYADQHIIFLGDEIIVGIRNMTLASGNSTTIIFMSPPKVPKGNYTISATADNSMTNGWVFVTIPGDVDGDRDVDIFDIVKMAGVYNVEKPDPRYDPNCDIDGDGDIDIFDIVEAAGNYNKSW